MHFKLYRIVTIVLQIYKTIQFYLISSINPKWFAVFFPCFNKDLKKLMSELTLGFKLSQHFGGKKAKG